MVAALSILVLTATMLLAACSPPERTSPPPVVPAVASPPTFVDVVWKVAESPTVATGQLYVFLSDGTLVITSSQSRPSLGTWRRDDAGFTMIEEGIPYTVDIVSLTHDEFRMHVNDPGEGVDLRLVRADAAE